MNKHNINPLTRTHDTGLNAAREVMPDADADTTALAAVMMNRGLLSFEEIRDMVMRARALPR